MKCFASQLIFSSPEQIFRSSAIKLNSEGIISNIYNLMDLQVESANTLFFDGIISSEIISLKHNSINAIQSNYLSDFNYFDFSEEIIKHQLAISEKPLVFDFGNNSISEINRKIKLLSPLLSSFSIFDIIAACVYYPALILGLEPTLTENRKTDLLIWQGLDLVNKKLRTNSHITIL